MTRVVSRLRVDGCDCGNAPIKEHRPWCLARKMKLPNGVSFRVWAEYATPEPAP